MKKLIIILLLLFATTSAMASEFEELDKIPEGAHKGQMFLGGFVSIGFPFGDMINTENDFLQKNYYDFSESQISKELVVNHLSFDMGVSYEYMPADHIGVKSKLRYTTIVQRTAFGSDYQNWSGLLFNAYSILAGPSFHLTNRKQWDISISPLIGYGFGNYEAAPVADKLVTGFNNDGKRNVSGLVFASELNLTVYFSGGLYLSLGGEYSYYSVSFSPAYSMTQPTTNNGNGKTYSSSGGSIQTINIILSAGYAFSN